MSKVSSSNFPLVSIIIVNWNGGNVFKKCLQSLADLNYPNWKLIIVDNGSTDGSNSYKVKDLKYELIQNDSNVGFAPANNQALSFTNGEFVLLLNNDTEVESDFLNIMVEKILTDENIGVMQPKIWMADSPDKLDNAGSFLTWTGFLVHWGYGRSDAEEFKKERVIHTAKGACMLVRKEVISKVGLFDDDFVSYFEESDFCGRVWLAGWKVLYYPRTSIKHKVGFTSKKLNQIEVNYHSLKNRIASYIKNFGFLGLATILIPHLFILLFLSFIYLLKFDFGKILMVFRALWWNLVNIPNLLQKRARVQNLRKTSDTIIFKSTLIGWKINDIIKHFFAVEKNFEK